MTDDDLEINLRSPSVVARRAIIIGALLRRLWLESLGLGGTDAEVAAQLFDIRAWLQTEAIWDSLSPTEIGFLETPAGALELEACTAIAWQTEGLRTLVWALGQIERLTPGYLDDAPAAIDAVPTPWDDAATWIAKSTLRLESDIARARDLAEVMGWRIGVELPRRQASGQSLADIEEAIANVAREAAAAQIITDLVDGNMTIAGQRLESIDEDDLEILGELAGQRLRALNWLCGYGKTWDDVPLDV